MSEPLKLKKCPFCGGRASFHIGEHDFEDAYVSCAKCGASGGLVNDSIGTTKSETLRLNKEVAAENWNKRVYA